MSNGPLTDFLRRLRGIYTVRGLGERTDAELLERFAVSQEESAFEALLQRHGPMVLGVCRHLLSHVQDVEDAFQATFLVLVGKASSIRGRSQLAGWLYRVAYRVAMRTRMNAARRRSRETPGVEMAAAPPDDEGIDAEMRPILHEELSRLPEKYRMPIVLCYLNGQTHEEAARRLAWPIGTVKGRLSRARELLRARLTRRGCALASAAAILSPKPAACAVPAVLTNTTMEAAMLIAAGHAAAAGMVSVQAAALCRGVLRTMFLTKLSIACAILLSVGILGVGAGLLAYSRPAEPAPTLEATPQPAAEHKEDKNEQKKAEDAMVKAARVRSSNNLKGLMMALWAYHDVNGHFPPQAIYDKNGKALLSWRVLLLPYLDEDELFKQFHLDEPWDSKHNKPLLAKMPKRYAPTLRGKTKEKYGTFYQVFVGNGALFEGQEGLSISDITDGTSQTIAIAEAAVAVPWSKPADLPYDPKKPIPKLGGLFDNGINAVFADASAHWLKKDFDAPTMRTVISRNAGDIVVDIGKIHAEK